MGGDPGINKMGIFSAACDLRKETKMLGGIFPVAEEHENGMDILIRHGKIDSLYAACDNHVKAVHFIQKKMRQGYAGFCRSFTDSISFKQGATGDEDFASPERSGHSLADRVREQIGPAQAAVAQRAWEGNRRQHNEICDTLQPSAWGYTAADDGQHHTADEVMGMLADAHGQNCNLLLNTGPLPDGAIHPEDVQTLREVGRRIRRDGWPLEGRT